MHERINSTDLAETKTLMLNICVRQNTLQNVVLELVRCAAALLILMFCAIASNSLCAQDQKLSEPPTTAPPVALLGPAGGFRAYVNFVNGDHGSIIDDVVPLVTAEMQGEAISFALSGGAQIVINVPPVIEP